MRGVTRFSMNAYLNCEKRLYVGEGEFDMPKMRPAFPKLSGTKVNRLDLACQKRWNPERTPDTVVHCFDGGRSGVRSWLHTDACVPVLMKARCAVSPDFPEREDGPEAVRVFNQYRSMWVGLRWQELGVRAIPRIRWQPGEDGGLAPWALDGVPAGATVCIAPPRPWDPDGGWARECWERTLEVVMPSAVLLLGWDPSILAGFRGAVYRAESARSDVRQVDPAEYAG